MDVVSKQLRSKIMRSVKSQNNRTTELRLIEIFKLNSIVGWRRNYRLFGKPDFAFPQRHLAVFVDGCFWHGHNCRGLPPKDNYEYWQLKFQRNRERDNLVNERLKKKGWTVFRLWECELKHKTLPEVLVGLLQTHENSST